MATVFDFGLLREFSDIFAWILIFAIVYGILQVTNLLKSRGLHALAAMAITVLLGVTGGATGVVTGLVPWFVITGFFVIFLMVLAE